MMKKYLLTLLILFSFKSFAQEPIIFLGTDNPLSDVIFKIDLLRICSHPTDNIPNHYFEITDNTIDLNISIHPSNPTLACDPLPPWIQSFLEVNFGQLAAGDYVLNIFFVSSDESVIDGTPYQAGPYPNPVYFTVASLRTIPTLSMSFLMFMSFTLLLIGLFQLNKHRKS